MDINNQSDARLRGIAANALYKTFGFRPAAAKSIILFEASGDGRYIRFQISGVEYVLECGEITAIYGREVYYEGQHYVNARSGHGAPV